MNYRVNKKEFESFFDAIKYAKEINAEVYQISNNHKRWSPAANPTNKKIRQYREQKAAYETQENYKKK